LVFVKNANFFAKIAEDRDRNIDPSISILLPWLNDALASSPHARFLINSVPELAYFDLGKLARLRKIQKMYQ
jgi:hypothetical protein